MTFRHAAPRSASLAVLTMVGALASAGDCHAIERTLAQAPAAAPLTLRQLVTPSARVEIQGRVVRFALHGLVYFETLEDLFRHVDREAGRWRFDSADERQAFGDGLLRRGVESRIVSMETELPLELLLTHTAAEIDAAVAAVVGRDAPPVFSGEYWHVSVGVYRDAFQRVRDRWSRSLNCWSASSSIPGRVLSNWYVIEEGIELFGATYDSTEHFWQAVKYHPAVTVGDLQRLLDQMQTVAWRGWLDALASDQAFYFGNAYAVEFLKKSLTPEALGRLRAELQRSARPQARARVAQQRAARPSGAPPVYSSLQEKVLWGDLADALHLVVVFHDRSPVAPPPAVAAMRAALVAAHFDAVYLDGYAGGRFGFLSAEFQALMLEIWKVKFLRHARFRDVIRGTAGVRLDHFLNDGDSPDIPIPVYVGYLNRIRDLAMETRP